MKPIDARGRLACLLAAAILSGGCATTPHPAPVPVVAAPTLPASEFTVAAVQLDAWNALGQILVNTQGVTYNARAQMMGLYDVDYRGERILLIAHGLVLDATILTPTTQIRATTADGKPATSAAAFDLLAQLQARLPDELHALASLPAPTPPTKARRKRR
ncbi:MAG: hypothetical protein JSR26_12570 [Proteobacteria bacterium]|nr:hypothetical protein [Pseudomonadota bacterium]